jgi:ATP-dependent RNA helicase HelY
LPNRPSGTYFENGGRAWYACPLKALSNAKYAEFAQAFGDAANVGILTGDRREQPDAPIIIGTTEILRNQLYDAMHSGVELETDFVVLDEAHFLGDYDRGVVWEEIMIYLPARIPLLLLSATIGNAREIADWLSAIRRKTCRLVPGNPAAGAAVSACISRPPARCCRWWSHTGPKARLRLYKKVNDLFKQSASRPGAALGPAAVRRHAARAARPTICCRLFSFLKSRADCGNALKLCMRQPHRESRTPSPPAERIDTLLAATPHLRNHRQLWHLQNLAHGRPSQRSVAGLEAASGNPHERGPAGCRIRHVHRGRRRQLPGPHHPVSQFGPLQRPANFAPLTPPSCTR